MPSLVDRYDWRSIPNRVHFVRQVDRDARGQKQDLHFEFKHFMAVYSAHLWTKPEKIYIWTDASEESIKAAKNSSNVYTKAIANLPSVGFHRREMPTITKKGIPIVEYAHKSDFIRAEVMHEYGGIYLDDDSWILKDLKPLRKAGFDNVIGRQAGGELCQAMWMSKPRNIFMQAWVDLQDQEFDGHWTTAGNILITQLHLDFSRTKSTQHVLVLEQDAFFPGDWMEGSLNMMYALHNDSDTRSTIKGPLNSTAIALNFKGDQSYSGWRRDWSTTYNLHGWSTGIKNLNLGDRLFASYGHLSPEYVLARRSNVARALYPALKHAIESNVLDY